MRATIWSLFEVDSANIRREPGVPFLICPISGTLLYILGPLNSFRYREVEQFFPSQQGLPHSTINLEHARRWKEIDDNG